MRIEGEPYLLPQIMPLWDIDYFQFIIFKKQRTQEETSIFPLTA